MNKSLATVGKVALGVLGFWLVGISAAVYFEWQWLIVLLGIEAILATGIALFAMVLIERSVSGTAQYIARIGAGLGALVPASPSSSGQVNAGVEALWYLIQIVLLPVTATAMLIKLLADGVLGVSQSVLLGGTRALAGFNLTIITVITLAAIGNKLSLQLVDGNFLFAVFGAETVLLLLAVMSPFFSRWATRFVSLLGLASLGLMVALVVATWAPGLFPK